MFNHLFISLHHKSYTMANVDEIMLRQLNERLIKLTEEGKELVLKVEENKKMQEATKNAIIGFGGKIDYDIDPRFHSLIKSANKLTDFLLAPKINVPKEYNKNLTWAQKTLFAISVIDGGFVPEIIEEIKHHEPDLPEEYLQRAITYNASKLYTEGIIDAEHFGKKHKYKLKKY